MHVKETGWVGVNYICVAQGREWWQELVNLVMKLQVPQKSGNVWDYLRNYQLLKKDSTPCSYLYTPNYHVLHARSDVPKLETKKIADFWNVMSCSLVEGNFLQPHCIETRPRKWLLSFL